MIAKLMTYADTREEAIDRQIEALDRFEIQVPGHNIDFLSALRQHPRFREGALTTGFIAEEYPEGFVGAPAGPELLRQLAAIGAFAGTAQADRARRIDGQLGKRLRPASAWQVKIADVVHDVTISQDQIVVAGQPLDISMESTHGDALIEAQIRGETLSVQITHLTARFRLPLRDSNHPARLQH